MLFSFKNCCDGAYSSVDVRFTKACDNACPFCIERTGIGACKMASTWDMAQAVIGTKIQDVLILGGEPMLYPAKVADFVTFIRQDVQKIHMTTSLPATWADPNNAALIKSIMSEINGLNVSIQSVDWQENNRLMNASSNHNRISILSDLNSKYADKIRVCINLVRGGIDTKEKLLDTLQKLENIGCQNVKINELQHEPNLYISFEDIMGISLPSPYAHGCSTSISIDGIEMTLLLKRSCFLVEESRDASVMDMFKAIIKLFRKPKNTFRVLYENAVIRNGWMKGQH